MRPLLIALMASMASTAVLADAATPMPPLAGHSVNVSVRSIKQVRESGTLLQQYDFSCGSAALATLLTHHYGVPVSEQDVLQQMFATGDQAKIRTEGFSLLDMKRYLQTLGFAADGFAQPLDKLGEARIPAVVLINESGYHHFVVIKGLASGRVLLGDPAKGTRLLSREAFEAIWSGRLLFVIHNRPGARFNHPDDWRTLPSADLAAVLPRGGMSGLSKLAPGDF